MEIKRDYYLKKLIQRKNNGLIKIITGIRRCGKSYLLNNIFYNHLINEGIKEDHILKFSFDIAEDLELIGEDLLELSISKRKVDPRKFMNFISNKIKDNETYYLLLDEIQNLGSFEIVLNGYLRKSNLDVYVTGSNSKFLSSDIITEFAGRGDVIHVMPLTFKEFYSLYHGDKDEALDKYFLYGGLPALCLMETNEQKMDYLDFQLKNVYLRDIINRYNLNNDTNINELLDILASNISSLVSPRKLSDTFKSKKNISISPATISLYIKYFEEAFLVSSAKRYDIKGRKYINSPFKVYFEDIGLRNARLNFRQVEETHIMENVIYNELRYRGYKIDVGEVYSINKDNTGENKKITYEIDFVANKGSDRYYIQSCYNLFNDEKKEQETKSFDSIKDSFKKIIIVNKTYEPRKDEKGYLIIGLKEFLLNDNSLNL